MVIDGVFTECALALQYRMNIPFIFFNTIVFAADVLATSGNPIPYSVVPTHFVEVSDNMNFLQKVWNAGSSLGFKIMRKVRLFIYYYIHRMLEIMLAFSISSIRWLVSMG
jgi:UDP-glucoronosyl and UDP-glucosyl transferase